MKGKLRINKKCGDRLRECREKKGMTQSELAKKSNYSIVQISYIENGKRGMSIEAARIFSKILEVREKYLSGEDDFTTKEDYLSSISFARRGYTELINIISETGYYVEEVLSKNPIEKFEDEEETEISVYDTDKWLIAEYGDIDRTSRSCSNQKMQEFLEDMREYIAFSLKRFLSKCEEATADEKDYMKKLYNDDFDDLIQQIGNRQKAPDTN